MKRKLFFFTISSLFLGFTVFIPYWTGVEAEKQFRLFNQHYPTHEARVMLKKTTYQRGWLESHAESAFEIAGGTSASTAPRVVIDHQIEHGFLPFFPTVIYSTLAPESDVVSWFGLTESPVQVKTILQLDGSGSSQLSSHPVNLQVPDKPAVLQLQPIDATLHFTPNFTKVTGELHLPQMALETEHGKVQLDNTQFTTDLQSQPDALWLGVSQCEIGAVNLLSRAFPAITVQQVKFSADTQLVDNYLQVSLKSQMQHLAVKQENYGPGDITVELRHLNVNSIRSLREILNDFTQLPTAQTNILLWGRLMQQGIALLSAQPELAMPRLNFTSPHGDLVGSALLGVDKVDATAWLYPSQLLESFHGKVTLSLPETLLTQVLALLVEPMTTANKPLDVTQTVQTLLANWLKRGWITQQDSTYNFQAQLQHGVLDLNGRRIPLTNLLP
jgi:uncharacterized protein YdgA (DUF945 family)